MNIPGDDRTVTELFAALRQKQAECQDRTESADSRPIHKSGPADARDLVDIAKLTISEHTRYAQGSAQYAIRYASCAFRRNTESRGDVPAPLRAESASEIRSRSRERRGYDSNGRQSTLATVAAARACASNDMTREF